MKSKQNIRFTLFLTMLLTATLACGQFNVGVETPASVVEVAEETTENQGLSRDDIAVSDESATTEPEADYSAYWVVMQDPRYDFRFAVPCFWWVEFPTEYDRGSGPTYHAYNYNQDYVMTFPRGQGVFEAGGVKVGLGIINVPFFGHSPGISLRDFVMEEYNNDQSEVVTIEDVIINDQTGIFVNFEYKEFGSTGQSYFFALNNEVFLRFGSTPEGSLQSQDVQGILNSLALTPEANMLMPTHIPGDPPKGLTAPCMGITELPPGPDAPPEGCMANSFDTVEEVANILQEYLTTGNTGGLVYELGRDPMPLGYWASEGVSLAPNDFFTALANSFLVGNLTALAEGKPSILSFTTDRNQFPPLMGMDLDNLFGPDVNITQVILVEGWGQDGQTVALLFIAQDDCGKYYWHGLVSR
jgi:hypothetical protein